MPGLAERTLLMAGTERAGFRVGIRLAFKRLGVLEPENPRTTRDTRNF